jgi:hypothetical protein
MERVIVDVWIDPKNRSHPLGPLKEDDGRVGLSALIGDEVYSGFLVVGREIITPGTHARAEYWLVGLCSFKVGDHFKLLDGARTIGSARVLELIH